MTLWLLLANVGYDICYDYIPSNLFKSQKNIPSIEQIVVMRVVHSAHFSLFSTRQVVRTLRLSCRPELWQHDKDSTSAVVMVIPPFDITEVSKDATIMTQHVFMERGQSKTIVDNFFPYKMAITGGYWGYTWIYPISRQTRMTS